MIKIICKECGTILPLVGKRKGDSTIMNSTRCRKDHYPDVICPRCMRVLVEGKPCS